MGKNRKARLIEEIDGGKLYIVASVNDENDVVSDVRGKRPVGMKPQDQENVVYLQEINRIEFETRNKEKENSLSFLAPNNVGILLSIANRALLNAKKIYDESIDPDKYNHSNVINGTTGNELIKQTLMVYDFIEAMQTCIVFGYTAIEAFTNLSINEDYKYVNSVDSKGIVEVYDKKAIERWLSLDVKISKILVEIYKCKSIKNDKIWSEFKTFEQCRNEIIHQKSIDTNTFYEKYFNGEIFALCSVPEKIIKFFFEKGKENGVTNKLWPLVINADNVMPIFTGTREDAIEFVSYVEKY